MTKNSEILKYITFLYFVISVVEVVAEYFSNKLLVYIFKPLIPIFIILMYILESYVRNKLFILAMLFSILTNLLFIPFSPQFLFYGIVAFLFHRILIVVLLFKKNTIKDIIPFLLATAPFLIVFFYMFVETDSIPANSFAILIIQNILIALIAGISLSSYVMNDNKQNSILLISAFLFVLLQFVVFIERYFMIYELKEFFRPMAMILNVFAFFTFYKYIVETEKSNGNGHSFANI